MTPRGLPVAAGICRLRALDLSISWGAGQMAAFQAQVRLQALSEVRHSNQRLEQALQETNSSLKETERQAAEDKAAWARRLEEQEAARWGMTHGNTPSEGVATCGCACGAPCWAPAQQVVDSKACQAVLAMTKRKWPPCLNPQ